MKFFLVITVFRLHRITAQQDARLGGTINLVGKNSILDLIKMGKKRLAKNKGASVAATWIAISTGGDTSCRYLEIKKPQRDVLNDFLGNVFGVKLCPETIT